MNIKVIIFTAAFICPGIMQKSHAQSSFNEKGKSIKQKIASLNIGDKVPASVWKEVPKRKGTKLVILDFWSTWCSNCMDFFPHMVALQNQFPDQLQVVLLNSWENDTQVAGRLKQLNSRRVKNQEEPIGLPPTLSTINGDTIFKRLFPAYIIPHHVWLDASGVVLAITHGYNATPEHVQALLDGKLLRMSLKKDLKTTGFDLENDGLIRPGGTVLIPAFYSGFTRYNPGLPGGESSKTDSASAMIRKTTANLPILNLYQSAFYIPGKKVKTILEVKDARQYEAPDWINDGNRMDEWNERNIFSYEISVPVKDEEKIRFYMQDDLNRFFGNELGIEGKLEKRKVPCFILIKEGRMPPGSEEADPRKEEDVTLRLHNVPFYTLLTELKSYLEDLSKPEALLDETGIDRNLNLTIQLTGDLKDLKNLQKQLKKYGLNITEGEREVDVLVIKDKS